MKYYRYDDFIGYNDGQVGQNGEPLILWTNPPGYGETYLYVMEKKSGFAEISEKEYLTALVIES